jgi:CRP/FNR family transcriptional regulator
MNVRIKCQNCAVRLSALCSTASEKAATELGRAVHRRRVPAGQTIYGGSQRAKTYAIIVSGVVKLTYTKPDGRNQIVGLQFPSQFVGRPYTETSTLMAEAATDLDLCCFSGRVFEGLLKEHPELERSLLQRTLDDLDSAREWMFMIGRKTAEERVASLLMLMARHMVDNTVVAEGGMSPASEPDNIEFDLPLSRTEIAECLGLRLETVSRQFAQLKAQGLIATGRRRNLRVCSAPDLKRIAENPAE